MKASKALITPRLIIRYWKSLSNNARMDLAKLTILTILTAVFELISFFTIAQLIKTISTNQSLSNPNPLIKSSSAALSPSDFCILFIISAILTFIFRSLSLRAIGSFSSAQGANIASIIFEKLLNQKYAQIKSYESPEVYNLLTNDINFSVIVINDLIQLASACFLFFSLFTALLFINILATLSLFCVVGFTFLIIAKLTRNILIANSQQTNTLLRSQSEVINNSLLGIKEILLTESQATFVNRFAEITTQIKNNQETSKFIGKAPRYIVELIIYLIIGIVIYSTFHITEKQKVTDIYVLIGVFIFASQRLLPLSQIVYSSITEIRSYWRPFANIISQIEPHEHKTTYRYFSGTDEAINDQIPCQKNLLLDAHRIGYIIPESQKVLFENIDIRLQMGQIIGLKGSSGTGKSTLMDIMMGLQEPSCGIVTIHGNRVVSRTGISTTNLKSYNFAHVQQAPIIFDDSIINNITYFANDKKTTNYYKLMESLYISGVDQFVDQLPEGLLFQAGEKGIRLSGGQRQRISIARSLYSNWQVLFMDEATSNLDEYNESLILQRLKERIGNRGAVIISHNANALSYCNAVFSI